jgi:hypothetical protein
MAPNSSGRADTDGDLLVARASDGRTLAVIWRYACHPVTFPQRLSISAEYPGVVRNAVRSQCGGAVPVLFWQGFAGDIRPRLGTKPSLRDLPAIMLRGPRFVPVPADAWQAWSQDMAERVVASMASPDGWTRLDAKLSTASSSLPTAQFISGSSSGKAFRLQSVSFGSSLTVVFASAEVVGKHADVLASLGGNAIGVGYAGDVFGYLPTAEQVREGGYEGSDWFGLFGIGHGFKRNPDEVWAECVAALANEMKASRSNAPREQAEQQAPSATAFSSGRETEASPKPVGGGETRAVGTVG